MQTNMLLQSMMAFVYAHRHNKDDLFLVQTRQENYIDFSVLRDCMYHYSKKAQDRFFKHAIETYFFAKFALSKDGSNFIKVKSNMSMENITKLLKYTADLKD
jgi:hypothetical protein